MELINYRLQPSVSSAAAVSLLSKHGPSSGNLERSPCLLQHLSCCIDQR